MKIDPDKDPHRLGISLGASILAHLLLVLMIGLLHEKAPEPKKKESPVMDVVLLDDKKPKPKTESKDDARTMANIDARGGNRSNDRITRQQMMPMGAPKPVPTPPSPPKTPAQPQEQNRTTRMLAKRGSAPESKATQKQQKKPSEPKNVDTPTPKLKMQNLMPSTMEMAQLTHKYQRQQLMKQDMSREADIPINTRQAKYAPYARWLVQALENQWRPGDANYQEYADDQRKALIKLTIESNGDLGGVEIVRPSPIPEINDSAIEAIHAAAPFKLLPSSWGLDRVSFYLTFEVYEDRVVFRQM